MTHPSHQTYISDSSLYDEKCRQCHRTDYGGDLEYPCPNETPEHKAERQKPENLKPGFYWTRFAEGEDWEPASFNGEFWLALGTDMPGEDFPFEIGERISAPTD